MAVKYSLDLRKKVINAIENDKMSRAKAARIFKINARTIYEWQQLKKETGFLFGKPFNFKGKGAKITDLQAFKKFVVNNPDLTQKKIGLHFNISQRTVAKYLVKIGFTYKKKRISTKNVIKMHVSNLPACSNT
jgi:transposase